MELRKVLEAKEAHPNDCTLENVTVFRVCTAGLECQTGFSVANIYQARYTKWQCRSYTAVIRIRR
jgi:hypothetical protein